MKLLSTTAAALIALSAATPVFAQSVSTGTADQQNVPAVRGDEPSNPQAMSSQNQSGQSKTLNQQSGSGIPQTAQIPPGCNPADSTCSDARGNPAVNSPVQKQEEPSAPAATKTP